MSSYFDLNDTNHILNRLMSPAIYHLLLSNQEEHTQLQYPTLKEHRCALIKHVADRYNNEESLNSYVLPDIPGFETDVLSNLETQVLELSPNVFKNQMLRNSGTSASFNNKDQQQLHNNSMLKQKSFLNHVKKDEGEEHLLNDFGDEINKNIVSLILSMRMAKSDYVIHEEDIIGLISIKKLIKDKIIYPILRPDLHIGLYQPPKGKTMVAKWIASESGAVFFEASPSTLLSKFYGETETIIKGLFKVAEKLSPSIIFFDEIDALLGKRRGHDDDGSIRMKNQLLQMMDGISSNPSSMVVVIGATNRPDTLDEAAVRRLSRRVLIGLPDQQARASQIQKLLYNHYNSKQQQHKASDTQDAIQPNSTHINDDDAIISQKRTQQYLSDEELIILGNKLEGWNGADIKALCTKAAEYAYDEALQQYGGLEKIPNASVFRKINYEDFLKALNEIKPSSTSTTSEYFEVWEKRFGCT